MLSPTESEQKYLDELLAAMRGPCVSVVAGAVGPSFKESFFREFQAALLINHYFLGAPLSTSSFEATFIRAVQAAGSIVTVAPDGGRYWDVEVDGRRISLKSSAAANLRAQTLHISKLCEAAWIQDVRGPTQREELTKALFDKYTGTVASIVQLRHFKKRAFYELVEIPTAILKQIADVPRAEFAPDGPSIGIPVGKSPPDFTLKLDRSDAKITLTNINKSICTVLATWQLDPEFGKSKVAAEVDDAI